MAGNRRGGQGLSQAWSARVRARAKPRRCGALARRVFNAAGPNKSGKLGQARRNRRRSALNADMNGLDGLTGGIMHAVGGRNDQLCDPELMAAMTAAGRRPVRRRAAL